MSVAFDAVPFPLTKDVGRRRASHLAVEAYHQFGGALVAYLRANLRCEEDAYDLAQEVYLRIARHEDAEQVQSIKAFAFAIAKNLLRDKSRRCATKLSANSVCFEDVMLACHDGDPLAHVEACECVSRIEAVIEGLRPSCREAYMLSRDCGLSYAAIAEQMRISVSMVEKHINAALRALRFGCQAN